ncbi:MAG: sensor histidine kinase [Actinomycetota bacterium]
MTDEAGFAQLIAGAGHELRSPLTSVKGFSATLVKRWDRFTDEQRLQFIETIHADSERMSRIVTEVLDLARAEVGQLELQLGPVNLGVCVNLVIERFQDDGIERLEVDVPDGLSAWTDRERLERGIENLIENALKFSDGPVSVSADVKDDVVQVAVSDNGPGVDPEHLPRIFSAAGPRGHKAPTGLGLGLVLMYRVLEAQGASLAVASEPSTGATFTITLPARGPDRL